MTDPIPAISPVSTDGTGVDTSRLRSRTNLAQAGQQFEAVFTQMMLKSMRQAHLADDELMGSREQDTFRDMQDQRVAQAMAAHQPLGIGRAMTEFLSRSQADLQSPAGTAPSADSTP